MKNKQYNATETIPKSENRRNIGEIDTVNKHIYCFNTEEN